MSSRAACLLVAFALSTVTLAGDENSLVGSYRLTSRAGASGQKLAPPEVIGFMTFTNTHRTVIMKWQSASGEPVSIAFIGTYTVAGGKYCESAIYGVNSNLGAPGVTYDEPSKEPGCTAISSEGSTISFDVPGEKLHLKLTQDGLTATTPRWTDTWTKVK
jgi:hypothetical protein